MTPPLIGFSICWLGVLDWPNSLRSKANLSEPGVISGVFWGVIFVGVWGGISVGFWGGESLLVSGGESLLVSGGESLLVSGGHFRCSTAYAAKRLSQIWEVPEEVAEVVAGSHFCCNTF